MSVFPTGLLRKARLKMALQEAFGGGFMLV
jgi:hypothetical protein